MTSFQEGCEVVVFTPQRSTILRIHLIFVDASLKTVYDSLPHTARCPQVTCGAQIERLSHETSIYSSGNLWQNILQYRLHDMFYCALLINCVHVLPNK